MQKKEQSLQIIKSALSKARRPAILWSGGKDSTVLLSLAKEICPDIEIIHFRIPFLQNKYAFQNHIIEQSRCNVHSWSPCSVGIRHIEDKIEVIETYNIADAQLKLARHCDDYDEEMPFVCVKEWLDRPKSITEANFDCILSGHKHSDIDKIYGPAPISTHVRAIGKNILIWYPIRDWSDGDVWEYINTRNIQHDSGRYCTSDNHSNADTTHACFNCVNKNNDHVVYCPKYKINVENISNSVFVDSIDMDKCGISK